MSQVYTDYGVLYDIFAGTTKQFQSVMIDPNTGKAQDMSDITIFASGLVNIVKADGTSIQSGIPVTFTNRIAGQSYVTWIAGPFTNLQAGNWMGFILYKNSLGVQIDEQIFNFKIKESF